MNEFNSDYWLDFGETFWQGVGEWIDAHALTILLIIVLAWSVRRFGGHMASRIFRKTIRPDLYPTKSDRVKRLQTLDSITGAIINVGVIAIGGLMILSEIGVNTTPLVASAGVIGIALGFGAQSLVKDFTNGLFIIADNQYRVGDVIKINGIAGIVESISLRTTALRSFNGALHHVPNGSIGVTSNLTMNYGGIEEDIVFSHDADIGKVTTVINRVGLDMLEDPVWAKKIKDPPHFVWVVGFDSNGIKVKIHGKTTPNDSWDVRGEFYRRLVIALRKAKLEIPFTQVTVHNTEPRTEPLKPNDQQRPPSQKKRPARKQ